MTTAAITADSPAQTTATGTGAGTVDITVTTADGTSHPTAADRFTYTALRPAVTGVSPNGGTISGGTTVTITGTGLAGATSVRFGNGAAIITADSSTQVTVTSPPGSGTVNLTVTTPAGTSQTSDAESLCLHHAAGNSPVDLLHRSWLGHGGWLGGLVGHRRRLG